MREILGDACAFIKGVSGEKNRYIKIGIAMRDGERISLKLDAVPLDKAWEGWVNVFPRTEDGGRASNKPAPAPAPILRGERNPDFDDDDIPF